MKDRSQLAVIVNGTDLQLGSDDVESITIMEDVKSLIPTLHTKFVDKRQQSQGLGIFQDGVPITVIIGDGKGGQPIQYGLNQWSIENGIINTAGNVAELNGIANIVPWMTTVITKAYKGNASDVATQLAQQAGIQLTDVTSTNDSMTWLPDGRTLGHFVRNLMDRAWIGEGSVPHMALTSQNGQWMMRIKDIMQQGSSGQSFTSIGLASSNDIPIWTFNINSSGGPLNNFTSYGFSVMQEMLDGTFNKWQNFSFSSMVKDVGISSSLQGAVGLVRKFYHPPDSGMTHKNYAKALHGNRMGRSTFSVSVGILTDQVSQVKLMDDIQLTLSNSDGTVNEAYSGTYKVATISRHISRGNYQEKIIATTQGTSAT